MESKPPAELTKQSRAAGESRSLQHSTQRWESALYWIVVVVLNCCIVGCQWLQLHGRWPRTNFSPCEKIKFILILKSFKFNSIIHKKEKNQFQLYIRFFFYWKFVIGCLTRRSTSFVENIRFIHKAALWCCFKELLTMWIEALWPCDILISCRVRSGGTF